MTRTIEVIQIVVPKEATRLRLDQFLARELPKFSRSRLQQLIREEFVMLNGAAVRPRELVRTGDRIELREPPPEKIDNRPEAIPLEILYEDEDLIVINKSAGLVVHPGAGHREHTLVNALLYHCPTLSGIGGKERPGIVHRLDKDTSGCLVVAKNDEAHRTLATQFAERTVEKIYLALVAGKLRKPSGVIREKIGRHPMHRQRMAASKRGRSAKTEYRILATSTTPHPVLSPFKGERRKGEGLIAASLVECTLHSGRTHQVRVHLHHLGHPVLGDKVYGGKSGFPRQMLHAWKLGFDHPRTAQRKNFIAPVPGDFENALQEVGISNLSVLELTA
jgi:23S rRNA pseudouridine1911/1915/1917 synthase